jgi:hypothetical protein
LDYGYEDGRFFLYAVLFLDNFEPNLPVYFHLSSFVSIVHAIHRVLIPLFQVIMVEKGSPPHAKKIRQYLASVGFDLYRELNVDYVFVNKKHAAAAGQPAHITK